MQWQWFKVSQEQNVRRILRQKVFMLMSTLCEVILIRMYKIHTTYFYTDKLVLLQYLPFVNSLIFSASFSIIDLINLLFFNLSKIKRTKVY